MEKEEWWFGCNINIIWSLEQRPKLFFESPVTLLGIWNLIFVLSNLCLFGMLPFAYLFCESEGLPFFGGYKKVNIWFDSCEMMFRRIKPTGCTYHSLSPSNSQFVLQGLIARAKETAVTLLLLSLMILGMMYVMAALIDRDKDSIDRILSERLICAKTL